MKVHDVDRLLSRAEVVNACGPKFEAGECDCQFESRSQKKRRGNMRKPNHRLQTDGHAVSSRMRASNISTTELLRPLAHSRIRSLSRSLQCARWKLELVVLGQSDVRMLGTLSTIAPQD
jgi:hypothetical protein